MIYILKVDHEVSNLCRNGENFLVLFSLSMRLQVRNVALGIISRRIRWKELTTLETIDGILQLESSSFIIFFSLKLYIHASIGKIVLRFNFPSCFFAWCDSFAWNETEFFHYFYWNNFDVYTCISVTLRHSNGQQTCVTRARD